MGASFDGRSFPVRRPAGDKPTQALRQSGDEESPMMVRVSVNNMNSGRLQVCCARPSANGYVLTYPAATAKTDVTNVLRALGINAAAIERCLATLADFGPNEMRLVEELEISDEVLRRNGFIAV